MELQTESLVLRTVTDADVSEVARMWDFAHGAISLDAAHEAIEYMTGNHARNTHGHIHHLCFAVCERGSDAIIGWCGLDGKTEGKLHIFYSLEAPYRGRGYATQAAKQVLAYAFNEAGVEFVNGGCDKENVASFRVMTKIGMAQSGFEDNGDPLFYIDRATYINNH